MVITTLTLMLFYQCKPEKDYREKYIGDYSFTTQFVRRDNNITYIDTTILSRGTVYMGTSKNDLMIYFLANDSALLKKYVMYGSIDIDVDGTGNLYYYTTSMAWYESGNISDQDISISFGTIYDTYNVTGKKID